MTATAASIGCMRTITLRVSDTKYEAVRRYAEADHVSMNSWLEHLLDAEDIRRRCAAHDAWMRDNPRVADDALEFLDLNQSIMAGDGLPNVASAG
jgi:hypothetical protein